MSIGNDNVAGRFRLRQRGKNGTWQICWYGNGQKRRLSCGTTDVEAARKKLYAHALQHTKPEAGATDEQLAPVLARYWLQYAQHLPSARSVKTACKHALEHWPDYDVSQLDRTAQLSLVASLRAAGKADATIQNW